MEQSNKPITVTYPDSKTAQRVVDLVVRKRPVGWSRKSYSSYYNDEYAMWIKKELDALFENRQPRVFLYASWKNCSPNTVYLRIHQSWHFLRDYLDPEGKYEKMARDVKISRERTIGIKLEYKDIANDMPQSEVFVPRTDTVKWKKQIDTYLEDDSIVKPLHLDKLLLSPEEVEKVTEELSGLDSIQFSVSTREIKIIKVSCA